MVVCMPQLSSENWSTHFPFLSAMFNLLHSSMNQEVFEKHLCIKSSHYPAFI